MEIKGAANSADIQSVLAQMRQLRAQASTGAMPLQPGREVDAAGPAKESSGVNFGATLKNAIDTVNELQQTSSAASNDFITGKRTDLVNVMIAGQKANLGFEAMVQVRNRMISAYQDIMNMPI